MATTQANSVGSAEFTDGLLFGTTFDTALPTPDGVRWLEDEAGSGRLDFSNGAPLTLGVDPDALNGLSAITVVTRVRADSFHSDAGIFATEAAPDKPDDNLGLRFDNVGRLSGGTDVISAVLVTTEGAIRIESSAGAAKVGEWIDIALTWTSGGHLELYINGEKDTLGEVGLKRGGVIQMVDLVNLGIGPTGSGWDGQIDAFAIYDRRLSDAEIRAAAGQPDTGQGNGQGGSSGANRAPAAAPDAFEIAAEDGARTLDVLANDSDADGDALQISGLTQPGHGSARIVDTQIVYEADPGFSGTDAFVYTVRDTEGAEDTATVTVQVAGDGGGRPNTAPVAADDTAMTMSGGDLRVDVLANDSDADGDALRIVSVGQPLDGVAWIEDGEVRILVDNGFAGRQTVAYTVDDGTGSRDTGTLSVDVAKMPGAMMPHADEPAIAMEHHMLMGLVARSDATHVAVTDGSWFDPDTWNTGTVPGDGATALIPDGVEVLYDGISAARITAIRVEGGLKWATDTDTKLMVETLLSVPGARLEIGTDADPVTANAEIVFHSTTPGELPVPTMGRGLVTHGGVSIVGEDKLDHTTLAREIDAGDTTLVLSEIPVGWEVGDLIVVGGTDYNDKGSDVDNSRFQDEVLEITAIDGRTIRFVNTDTGENRFRFDHITPEGYDFEIHVGNLSRSITFSSEFGNDTAIPDRGHVMFMHSKDVVVKHTAFDGLGRADKNRLVDDAGTNVDGSLGADGSEEGTNPRGRYAVHFHRNLEDEDTESPAIAEGLAVNGSPGWGIVHHDSHLELTDSVVFDVVGSAFAAEAGNEIGLWENNLSIKTTGDDNPLTTFDGSERVTLFDFGFNGEAYWIQGAPLLRFVDNTAHSANGAALEIFSDADGNTNRDIHGNDIPVAHLAPEQRDLYLAAGYKLTDSVNVAAAIVTENTGFQAINSRKGIEIWNHMRNDDGTSTFVLGNAHELRSEISDFELWGIFGRGIFMQYSSQIDFVNGIVVGDPDDPVAFVHGIGGDGTGVGISNNNPTNDIGYHDIVIDGFEGGLRLPWEASGKGGPYVAMFGFNATEVVGLTVRNVESVFANVTAADDNAIRFPDHLVLDGLILGEGTPTGLAPVALIAAEGLGGTVVGLDGGGSYDMDPPNWIKAKGNAIAAYGWDFDGDGAIDQYGRLAVHDFASPGAHDVSLTVWDSDGQSTTTTRTVQVKDIAYDNLLKDGGFAAGQPDDAPWHSITAVYLERGWQTRAWSYDAATGAMSAPLQTINNGLFQVRLDNQARKGLQEFSFDLDYDLPDGMTGELQVAIWGIDGEFNHRAGAERIGAEDGMPLDADRLFFAELGETEGMERQSFAVDFGDGYEFVTVSLRHVGKGSAPSIEDDHAVLVDNFAITDNAGPVAENDSPTVVGSGWTRLDVLANDFARDGSALRLQSVGGASEGQVRIVGNQVEYRAAAGAHGSDTITYTVADGSGRTDTGTVALRLSPVSTDGLFLDVAFDEGQGRGSQNLVDTGALDGVTLFAGVSWRDGVTGSAVEFDGSGYVSIDSEDYNNAGPWNDGTTHQRTVSLWFQADDLERDGRQYLYQEGYDTEGVWLAIEDGLLVAGGQSRSRGWDEVTVEGGAITEDDWHNVTLVVDGDAGRFMAYLDGVRIGTANAAPFLRHPSGEALGNGVFERDRDLDAGFDGAIDRLMVFDRSVSESEIATLAML